MLSQFCDGCQILKTKSISLALGFNWIWGTRVGKTGYGPSIQDFKPDCQIENGVDCRPNLSF